jgi:N-carbamoylputrescine amidase
MYFNKSKRGSGLQMFPVNLFAARLSALIILGAFTNTARTAETSADTNRTVKVAAIQFISEFGKPEVNRRGLEPLIRKAAKAGAKIVVLPETAITGYTSTDLKTTWQVGMRSLTPGLIGTSPKDAAEPVPGESTTAFCKLAGELGIYLSIPLLEIDPKTGRYFNTVVLASPKGEMLLHYRKLNPWPWAERGWAAAGDHGLQYVDTPYGRLGLLICFDINFEPPRLKEAGIDSLLYSIAWVDDASSSWFAEKLPAIAKKNNFSIIGANWSMSETPKWHGYGHSLIIDRTGKILAKVGNDIGNEIVYAELPVPASQRSKTTDAKSESMDLTFLGTVTSIEISRAEDRLNNWVVTTRVDKIVSGDFSGEQFSFRVHSPSLSGLVVGKQYQIRAAQASEGYTVDQYQWRASR